MVLVPLFSISQNQSDTNKVNIKDKLINESHQIDTVDALVLYIDTSMKNGEAILYNNEVRFIFTYEEVQKINSTYRLVELMNNVIDKFDTEKDYSINIINGLNDEITLLNEKLNIKDKKIENGSKQIDELLAIIDVQEEKDQKQEELLDNNELQIKNLKKENKKLNFISKLTGGSTLILIVAIIILI